jgi:proton-translocating NADH-quinone oxidoreductase chain L
MIGLMAVWAGMGTFSFSDYQVTDADGKMTAMPGIYSQVRPEENDRQIRVPDGMVRLAKGDEVARITLKHGANIVAANHEIARNVPLWRAGGFGYGLLVLAGLGIFCGCVGKSAQFPLHVWLPDAMEGPTPVSALIHAATMVAAGVYLVGRFYPVFTPEVLLVIASVGCITLFLAATVALTATDIKRVLAYSTVSQLGFMMLALGLGGWVAGMFHLFTHAFFKSLLFLCSGSVIHACGTNEMPMMGGLRKKMPWTAGTMLVGCLAIAGAGVPTTVVGLSGFFSKDSIIAQDRSFWTANPRFGAIFYAAALVGAGLTAFYMFRLWYMTFAGNPRDGHVYYHAHESPKLMTVPLVILAVLAAVCAWNVPGTNFGLQPLLEQARPAGIGEGIAHGSLWPSVTMPAEHQSHLSENSAKAEWTAFFMAMGGFVLATTFYGLRKLDPKDVCRTFSPIYQLFLHKWWFDELYAFLFVRPVLRISGWVAAIDKNGIDWLADNSARAVMAVARLDDWIDRIFVDKLIDLIARWTYALGLRLRTLQTGNIRQYIMWIVVGTVGLFALMSLY